jgi:hypothetical protein
MANEQRLLAGLTAAQTTQLEALLKTWLTDLEPPD